MKFMSKFVSLFLSVLIVFSLFNIVPMLDIPVLNNAEIGMIKAEAKEVFNSGYCGYTGDGSNGQNLSYSIDDSGVLTITGSGKMLEPSSSNGSPFAYDLRIQTVVIGEGVTTIGAFIFEGCTNLVSISIPDTVSQIGFSAFLNCTGLESVVIPEGITTIESNAFRGCSSLVEVTIPSTVTEIKQSGFDGCSSLAQVDLPEGLTTLISSSPSRI